MVSEIVEKNLDKRRENLEKAVAQKNKYSANSECRKIVIDCLNDLKGELDNGK